ncbi:gamma-glutamylcyclotransferase [Terriglobus albidus]|uniref:Gamma-glutamylcyclotransferase n=2 Tax=Terriglobus albidus TaxID=1592106 RepID=A0A5B9EHF5_9BACT|nr:gamma-glutamylcyclotransferase [Terriglobus albidus]
MEVTMRLASYGTLAPGKPNHYELAGLKGRWLKGVVRGHLYESGWGAALGYPGLILDENGPEVTVHLFESSDLPAHWDRLDEFEGPGYERVVVSVSTDEGVLEAYLYALAPEASGPHRVMSLG